jgi:hypothetical protein
MGLLRMAARTAVVAGTATAVSGRVARRQARKYGKTKHSVPGACPSGPAARIRTSPKPRPRTI